MSARIAHWLYSVFILSLIAISSNRSDAVAQDIIAISGDGKIYRIDPATCQIKSTVNVSPPLNSFETITGHRVATEPDSGPPFGFHTVHRVTTLDSSSNDYRNRTLNLSSGALSAGCIYATGLNGTPIGTPSNYSSQFFPIPVPPYFISHLDNNGKVYYSGSCNAGTTLFGSLPIGTYTANTVGPNGNLFVVKVVGGGSQQLVEVAMSMSPDVPQAPTVLGTWTIPTVTYPQAWNVLGIAIDVDGRLYAIVNKGISCVGHGYGDVIIAKSNETLGSSSTLTLVEKSTIFSWFNGGVGCLDFPVHQMSFDEVYPAISTFTANDQCGAIQFTADWTNGIGSGTITSSTDSNFSVAINDGETKSVVVIGTQLTTYTLTVQTLSGIVTTTTDDAQIMRAPSIGVTTVTPSSGCPGMTPLLSFAVDGGTPTATYQLVDLSTNAVVKSGTVTNPIQYSAPQLSADKTYELRLSNPCDNPKKAVAIDVFASPNVTSTSMSPLVACPGDLITFSADISLGDVLPVQWELLQNESAIRSGSTNTTHVDVPAFSALASDAWYRIGVKNSCMMGFVYSDPIKLSIKKTPTILSWQLQPSGLVCTGDSVQVQATLSSGILPVDWQLKQVGGGITLTGQAATSSILSSFPAPAADASYQLGIKDVCTGAYVFTSAVSVDVKPSPQITQELTATPVAEGSPFLLSVVAIGDSPLKYTWYRDGVQVQQGPNAFYYVPSATIANAGNYDVVVDQTNPPLCGSDSSSALVNVVIAPQNVIATQGQHTDKILLTWSAVPGAASYRVSRADTASGMGLVSLGSWQPGLSFSDLSAIPGIDYWYQVKASPTLDGATSSQASAFTSGWRKLSAPTGVSAIDASIDAWIEVTWNFPAANSSGAGFYRVYRSITNDFATAEPVSSWINTKKVLNPSLGQFDNGAPANTNFFYWVEASVDAMGSRSSDPSVADTGSRLSTLPPPLNVTAATPVMIVLLDYSKHMGVASRWDDAVAMAKDDVKKFFAQCSTGAVAVWTFGSEYPSNLTLGYVDQASAMLALDALPPLPSNETASLSAALCSSLLNLCSQSATGGSCSPFSSIYPTPANGRILSIYSAGTHDSTFPNICSGPSDTNPSHNTCIAGPSAYTVGTWQWFVCNFLSPTNPCTAIFVRDWDALGGLPPSGGSPLAEFAISSGGAAQTVVDGQPLPPSFFDDCNNNLISDATDISNGTSIDCNSDGVPDECQSQLDCDGIGGLDSCQLAAHPELDRNENQQIDACEGFKLTGPTLPISGLTSTILSVGASPNTVEFVIAGLQTGTFALACPGQPVGIVDFVNYGAPLLWLLPTDGTGFSLLELPIPPGIAGLTAYFQGIELAPTCRTSNVLGLTFQ